MNEETTSNKATRPGGKTQSRQGQYAKFEPLINPSIDRLKEMLDSRNESIALGAIKIILERTVPAIKALEITGENGEPIKLTVIGGGGFIPGSYSFNAAPTGSPLQPASQVQGFSMAPESKKDDNSDNGTGQADTT